MIDNGIYQFKGIHEFSYRCDGDDCQGYYIKLNNEVYSFKENPSDGYRSFCDEEKMKGTPPGITFNFEDNPFEVYVENFDDGASFTGIKLYDSNDADERKELGELGTNYADDYYPSCVMYLNISRINDLYFYGLVSS